MYIFECEILSALCDAVEFHMTLCRWPSRRVLEPLC